MVANREGSQIGDLPLHGKKIWAPLEKILGAPLYPSYLQGIVLFLSVEILLILMIVQCIGINTGGDGEDNTFSLVFYLIITAQALCTAGKKMHKRPSNLDARIEIMTLLVCSFNN